MSTPTAVPGERLPAVIRTYLAAHAAGAADEAARCFTASAVVVDEDRTFRGTEAVRRFLRSAGAEFSYTTELIGGERVDEAHWVARQRLEGDFPGGVADLRYRFTLAGDLIAGLTIAP